MAIFIKDLTLIASKLFFRMMAIPPEKIRMAIERFSDVNIANTV